MPLYIYRGRYSADAAKGMMASPEDREAALAKVFANAGGRLLAFYMTFGEDDFLTVADVATSLKLLSPVVLDFTLESPT